MDVQVSCTYSFSSSEVVVSTPTFSAYYWLSIKSFLNLIKNWFIWTDPKVSLTVDISMETTIVHSKWDFWINLDESVFDVNSTDPDQPVQPFFEPVWFCLFPIQVYIENYCSIHVNRIYFQVMIFVSRYLLLPPQRFRW